MKILISCYARIKYSDTPHQNPSDLELEVAFLGALEARRSLARVEGAAMLGDMQLSFSEPEFGGRLVLVFSMKVDGEEVHGKCPWFNPEFRQAAIDRIATALVSEALGALHKHSRNHAAAAHRIQSVLLEVAPEAATG